MLLPLPDEFVSILRQAEAVLKFCEYHGPAAEFNDLKRRVAKAVENVDRYIVIYPDSDKVDYTDKRPYSGYWYMRSQFENYTNLHHTGEYEVRHDGAIAEIWKWTDK